MIIVDTIFKVEDVKEKILNSEVLGVDIETYDYKGKDFGTIRLVQIATENEVYIYDLMKTPLPDYLKEVFKNDRQVKVFHFGFFDMSHLIKEYNCVFNNTFCTANATRIIGCGLNVRYSLKKVAEMFLGEEIDKSEQKSDWGGELTESQIAYASKDASILLKLYKVQLEYLTKKGLKKIAALENAIQRIDAFNYANRFFPDNEKIEKDLKDIEENYFRGISTQEIEKATNLPQTVQDKIEEYNLLKKIKEKGFYPQFRTNWKENGFFFQKNYLKELRNYFNNLSIIRFNHLELPAIHANAKDFKSIELYSDKNFFNTRQFLLLKAIGLRDADLMADLSHLVNDFREKIPGIIKWQKRMFTLLSGRKPVRLATGKVIHTKQYLLEEKEGFISFLIEATISDFIKSVVVLIEKSGCRVLQLDAGKKTIEVLNCKREIIENAILLSSKLMLNEELPLHFYSITGI